MYNEDGIIIIPNSGTPVIPREMSSVHHVRLDPGVAGFVSAYANFYGINFNDALNRILSGFIDVTPALFKWDYRERQSRV
jgi:hypothetical protein